MQFLNIQQKKNIWQKHCFALKLFGSVNIIYSIFIAFEVLNVKALIFLFFPLLVFRELDKANIRMQQPF